MVFLSYFPYANSMKRTPGKKAQSRPYRKWQVIVVLVVSILLLGLAISVAVNKIQQRQEAAAFSTLKQDLLSLREGLNNIDPGWKYSEECWSEGGVYSHDIAHGCGITLSKEGLELAPGVGVDDLLKVISDSGSFRIKNKTESKLPAGGTEISVITPYVRDKNIHCAFGAAYDESKTKLSSMSIGCTGNASQFYFKQTN
jgi:hypothetical protein